MDPNELHSARNPATPLQCPQCGASVPPGRHDCPECGVDLVLYIDTLFRHRMEEALAKPPASPASVEELVPRLGESLLAQGVISSLQLKEALNRQEQLRGTGALRRLGQVLVEMGAVRPEQLDRAVATMVVDLQRALQEANRNLEARVEERTNELSRTLERLSELNQLKANFIANVSHELRTPMTHIVGYLDLLAEDTFGPLSAQQREAVDTIRRASQRLYSLIEDLIQFSDTSRGAISLSLQNVALRDVVQEALSRLMAKAQRGNVRIDVRLPADLPPVRADLRKLAWVITQLLDNGIKFTPSGGRVEITAEPMANRVQVVIEDSGIGIPASRLPELFQPFHQLDGSLTRKHGGTGLGLSLCKQILDAHGAPIQIRSEEGRGSRFSFALKISSTPDGTPASQSALPGIRSEKA